MSNKVRKIPFPIDRYYESFRNQIGVISHASEDNKKEKSLHPCFS
jgi:hypothetical protein